MDNDNFRRDRDEDNRRDDNFRRDRNDNDRFDDFENLQFGPGRFPMPPTPPRGPERFPTPPTPPREPGMPPRMEGPRSAPPNFTPQFQQDMMRRPMDIRRCVNRFVFIWLVNGNGFWFFPIFVGRDQIVGFRWRRNGWMYDRINLRRIAGFRCF